MSVRDPDSLVRLRWSGNPCGSTHRSDYGRRPEGVGTTFPYEVFKQFAATSASSAELLACAPLPNAHAVVDGQAAIVSAVVASGNYHQVMGVVTDSRYNSLREPTPPTMDVPFSQFAKPSAFVQIRTAGNQLLLLASVREGVRQVDPDLPLANVYAQVDQIERRPAEKKVLRAPASSLARGVTLRVEARTA